MTPEIFKQGSLQTGYRLFVNNIYILENGQQEAEQNNNVKIGDIIIEFINKGVAPPYMDIYALLEGESDNDHVSLRGLITNDKRNITFSNINITQLNQTTSLNLTLTSPKVPWNIPYTADCSYTASSQSGDDDNNKNNATMVQFTIGMIMMMIGTIIAVIIF
eukprot:UN03249